MSKELLAAIQGAGPVPKIAAALEDDPIAAGIVVDDYEDSLVGSRLFNVATAAMDALRVEPTEPVIARPLQLSQPEDRLERFTMRILNNSLERSGSLCRLQFTSPVVDKLGTCSYAEERFLEAVESAYGGAHDPEATPLLLVDSSGQPIMLKKPNNELTTLTFKPIEINHVRYPGGTLLNMLEQADMPVVEYGNLDIGRADPALVRAIAALRFSFLAFEPAARQCITEPIPGYELSNDDMQSFTQSTLSNLRNMFPDQQTLRQIYADPGLKP